LTFVRDATLFAVPFDLARMTTTGPEVPVVEDISTVGPQNTGDYAFSQNGLLVYSEALDAQGTLLTWVDRRGTPQPIPGQVRHDWATGRLSPDGTRVVNGIKDSKGTDLWVADLARTTLTRLTFGGDNDFPIWSPDSTRIVYSGLKDGKPALFSVLADGSGQPELVIAADSRPIATSFTPDGKTLLYTQSSTTKAAIVLLPLGGPAGAPRERHQLREPNMSDGQATVSPDGRWVAFTSIDTGTAEVYVQPFPGPGAKVRVSTASGRYPRWTRNGRELLYWTASPGNAGLMSVTVKRRRRSR
jgi:Tol biopolymer transport system component